MAGNMGFPSNGESNQGWKLYLTSLIMILGAGLVVIARVAARYRMKRLNADDYAIVGSLAFSIILSVNIQLAVVHGYGQHKRDLSTEQLRTCLKFFFMAQTPYKIVVCLNKTSAILLYMRIFISQRFRTLCYVALAIVIGSGVATTFATIFQCLPVERSWNKDIKGVCIDSSAFWLANAVLNIGTDVIVLALPIREIFKLHLKLQEKIMLQCVFLLGGFVTITSILRVTAVANSMRNMQDQTWNFIQRGIWTLIEANLGIICACLIVLKHPTQRLLRSCFGSSEPPNYDYGSSDTSAKRNAARQHFRLDDTYDDKDIDGSENGETAQPVGDEHQMKSIAHRISPKTSARSSDERERMSEIQLQHSVESTTVYPPWLPHRGSGITKTVDVRIHSRPTSL